MLMRFSLSAPLGLLALSLLPLRADVKLPAIFGDHMVLQRDGAAPVWGTADPGETVTVAAGPAQGTAVAGADGKWMVKLSGLPASSRPIDVTVRGKNTLVFHDVLVGDVWVCSGQSNMEFGMKGDVSAAEEIPQANHPEIRLFLLNRHAAPAPVSDCPAPADGIGNHWVVCTPETVVQGGWLGFTAVGYFFGRDVAAFTRQPVGLIESSWGGTPIQAWTSLEAFSAVPAFKQCADNALWYRTNYDKLARDYPVAREKWEAIGGAEGWRAANKDQWDAYQAALEQYNAGMKALPPGAVPPPHPRDPTPRAPADPATLSGIPSALFNGMIAPLIPYGIKGAIWYQGEGNATRAVEYGALLPLMIADWRGRWAQGDFPFLIVQIANFMRKNPDPSESDWAALREAQEKTGAMPGNGVATAIDLGDASNIHPQDKDDVGARLALAARKIAYGDAVVFSGPTYAGAAVEGGAVRVRFDNAGTGLVIGVPPAHFHPGQPRPDTSVLKGFAIAGADGKYVWADARIDGQAVLLSSPQIPQPVYVRYDWADNPDGNLYNKEGLPALPFRTDDFPVAEVAKQLAQPPASAPAKP